MLVRRFRHAGSPDKPFACGTDYVELPDGADEGYCVMQDGRHSARHSAEYILASVTSGHWVEIPYIPMQETTVIRYFHHRTNFANGISHAELVNGRLDAKYYNGTRMMGWWPAGDLDGFLRHGDWIEFFPDQQHDLFIDQAAADTEHELAQLERNARFETWTFKRREAHGRLMEKCFTDTRRARWPLERKIWSYKRTDAFLHGREYSVRIAAFIKNPSLSTLRALYERSHIHKVRDETIKQWLTHYDRGEYKFCNGEWREPPWHAEAWYYKSEHCARQAHVSIDDPTKVAFTESLDKLERDIQTRMKPGRFLQRYFSDVLSEQEIREWAHRWERMHAPPEVRFIESDNPDGWEDVYARDYGFDSCMTGSDSVRVYAYPNNGLRLAYMTNDDGATLARCIVVEPNKTYVRVYGDDRLGGMLEALGYNYKRYALREVRIRKVERDSGWAMPFIDGKSRKHEGDFCAMWVTEHNDCWVIDTGGDYHADSTTGYIEGDSRSTCGCCGARCNEDNVYYSEYHEVDIGECCIDDYRYAHTGQYNEDWIHEDTVVEIDGEYWLDDPYMLRRQGFEQCDKCGEWHAADDMTTTSRGLVCGCTEVVELAVEDNDGNSWACIDDTKSAIDIATGELVTIHEDTDYDEEYADPDTLDRLPLPTGSQTRPHDTHTTELFAAA